MPTPLTPVLVDFWVAGEGGVDEDGHSINDIWVPLVDAYDGIATIGGGQITHNLVGDAYTRYAKDTPNDKITFGFYPS